jgi:hypothetical protein
MIADDKILSGDKFYLVRGCFAYLTQERERHTAFCYILAVVGSAGNPNPNPGDKRFEFVTCRSGFEAT